ncbi:MAG: fibronectin type III domain-containing protein, partial [Lachnospiraceae bacterium]|nr:fibronectin type III domain-containing protein [Lachnospiraceae bacterium]
IYRKTSANADFRKLKEVKANSTSYTDKSGTGAKTYYYAVRAYRNVDGKKVSGAYTTSKVTTKPATVKASAKAVKAKQVKVTWKNIAGESGYTVMRKTAKGKWKTIANVKANKVSYVDKTAKKGTKYYYAVKAYKNVSGKKLYGKAGTTKLIKAK